MNRVVFRPTCIHGCSVDLQRNMSFVNPDTDKIEALTLYLACRQCGDGIKCECDDWGTLVVKCEECKYWTLGSKSEQSGQCKLLEILTNSEFWCKLGTRAPQRKKGVNG
jgi:hypothetical protein